MSDKIEESVIEDQPTAVDLEGTKQILSQMENCIVKIVNPLFFKIIYLN